MLGLFAVCPCSAGYVSLSLAKENTEQRMKLNEYSQEMKKLKRSRISKETVLKIRTNIKNVEKENKILRLRLKTKTQLLKSICLKNSRLDTKVVKLCEEKTHLNDVILEKEAHIENLNTEILALSEKVKTKGQELNESVSENEWLREIVENENNIINIYDEVEKKYTFELRECIYKLLKHNVSSRQIAPVIESVLTMVNKVPNRLPARSTILDMNIERLLLSQTQLAHDISMKENTTLYTDETTKFGTKYMGYHLSDMQGTMYVLGLREIETKSASDTLTTLQDILKDLDDCLKAKGDNVVVSKRLLANIVATMSDRASTEIKFNQLLQDFRSTILPDLVENWVLLSNEDQLAISQVMNFFCGLHSIVHF